MLFAEMQFVRMSHRVLPSVTSDFKLLINLSNAATFCLVVP